MEAHPPSSPFLALPASEWVASNELAFAIRDRYPVSPGHTLVIPRRLVATWFEATPAEQRAIFDLVEEVRRRLDASHPPPDGYNVGFNAGPAAGQTVMHLHVHVIPRYSGDVEDPTGGVRHVIPDRGNYLAERAPPLATGGSDDPFLLHLAPLWARATEVAIVAAFVQEGGLDAIGVPLFDALTDPARSVRVRLVTGDYLAITQAAALERLLDWSAQTDGRLEARVVETAALPTRSRAFHPKSWRFEGPGLGVAFVGSSPDYSPGFVARSARCRAQWGFRAEGRGGVLTVRRAPRGEKAPLGAVHRRPQQKSGE